MADSVRKRIRDRIVETLWPIARSIDIMSAEPAEVRDATAFPSIVVHPVSDTPATASRQSVAFETRVATFALECWVVNDPTDEATDLSDAVEDFLARVQAALVADPSLGGPAMDVTLGAVVFLLLVRNDQLPQQLGGFELTLAVNYRWLLPDPTAG